MADSCWKSASLFGGAIQCPMPAKFVDVSDFRDVPDNQEVYADAETDRSLIVEALEMVECDDADIARYHFRVLAEDMKVDNPELLETAVLSAQDCPQVSTPTVIGAVAIGRMTVAKYRDSADKANLLNVYLACLRIRSKTTDLLLTFNDPILIDPTSAAASDGAVVVGDPQDTGKRTADFKAILRGFTIKDFAMFGE